MSLHGQGGCLQILEDIMDFFEYGATVIERQFSNTRLPYDYEENTPKPQPLTDVSELINYSKAF
jgi:hypothetical protein